LTRFFILPELKKTHEHLLRFFSPPRVPQSIAQKASQMTAEILTVSLQHQNDNPIKLQAKDTLATLRPSLNFWG